MDQWGPAGRRGRPVAELRPEHAQGPGRSAGHQQLNHSDKHKSQQTYNGLSVQAMTLKTSPLQTLLWADKETGLDL